MKRKTKQNLVVLLAAAVAVIALFTGCSSEPAEVTPTGGGTATVTFNKNNTDIGSTEASPRTIRVAIGNTIDPDEWPIDPTRPGYDFLYWHTRATGTGKFFNKTDKITANITVYARWSSLGAGEFTVTFLSNGGDTQASPRQKVIRDSSTTIDALPLPPEKANSLFKGWNTKADGSGTPFTAATPVNAHTIVYAQWETIQAGNVVVSFYDDTLMLKAVQIAKNATVPQGDFPASIPYYTIDSWKTQDNAAFTTDTTVDAHIDVYVVKTFTGGTPEKVGDTVVHNYPKISTSGGGGSNPHGAFTGTVNADGSFTITSGGIRYLFSTIESLATLADYDFIKIDYIASGVNSLVYKQYNSTDNYATHGSGISDGTGNITFVINQATQDGFAIQKYQAGTGPMTIQITKITFTQGTRYNVTFSLGTGYAGTDPVPAARTVVDGIALGALPTVTWTGYSFNGWVLGSESVTANTIVGPSFNNGVITATWKVYKPLNPLTITFNTTEPGQDESPSAGYIKVQYNQGSGAQIAIINTGAGYRYKKGSSGYEHDYAKFVVDFGAGNVIGDYDKISFKMKGIRGDTDYKNISLLGGSTLTGTANSGNTISENPVQYTGPTTEATITLVINKGKVAALTSQTLEIAIHFPAAATGDKGSELPSTGDEVGGTDWGTSGKPTTVEVYDVVFAQN